MHSLVREFEAAQVKQERVDFRPGDTVRVHVRIIEGGKERIQDFEGVCIRRHGGGMGETFTVRRISYGVGMERVFPINSPRVAGIEVVRRGKVRRANLAYLRGLSGKKARITEDLLRTRKHVMESKEQARREAELAAEAEKKAAEEEAKAAAEAEKLAAEEQAKAEEEPAEEAAEQESPPSETEAAAEAESEEAAEPEAEKAEGDSEEEPEKQA